MLVGWCRSCCRFPRLFVVNIVILAEGIARGELTNKETFSVERINDLEVLRSSLDAYGFGGFVYADLVVIREIDDRAFGCGPGAMAAGFYYKRDVVAVRKLYLVIC